MTLVKISQIDYEGRSRKQMGDIAALAASIDAIGLLHPIVLTPEHKLVVGRRRIEAYKHLGHDTIEANIAKTFADVDKLLKAEGDENTCRENLTPEEAVEHARRLEPVFRAMAEAEQKAAGGDKKSDEAKSVGKSLPKRSKRDESKRTRSRAAAVVGWKPCLTNRGEPW